MATKRIIDVMIAKMYYKQNLSCMNPERRVVVATKYFTVAPNICVPSARNLLQVTIMAPRILRWLLDI